MSETYSSSKEAVDKIKKYSADLVITDWLMSEMDGLDVCRTLKTNKKKRL